MSSCEQHADTLTMDGIAALGKSVTMNVHDVDLADALELLKAGHVDEIKLKALTHVGSEPYVVAKLTLGGVAVTLFVGDAT